MGERSVGWAGESRRGGRMRGVSAKEWSMPAMGEAQGVKPSFS